MIEIPSGALKVWEYVQLGFEKLRELIMYLSTILAKYVGFPADNIYNVLLIVLAIWIASKIFFMKNNTIKGRYFEYIITAAIIYFIIKLV